MKINVKIPAGVLRFYKAVRNMRFYQPTGRVRVPSFSAPSRAASRVRLRGLSTSYDELDVRTIEHVNTCRSDIAFGEATWIEKYVY